MKPFFERLAERYLSARLEQMKNAVADTARAANAEKERIEAIVKGLYEGVLVIDAEGKVLLINRAFADLFEADEAGAPGRHFWEVFRQETIHGLIRRALGDFKPLRGDYGILVPEEKYFQVQISPIEGPSAPLGLAVILHDVTAIRKLERMRTDFVANVSHELKTPLASILGAAETLQAGAIDDPGARGEFVEMIRRQSSELKKLIEDLLDLAKIESGSEPVEKRNVPAAELFDSLRTVFDPLAREKKVSLSFEAPDGLCVFGSRTRLRQALSNLIENAIKYTDAGGSVRVRALEEPAGSSLVVEDTGIGLSEEDRARVFERFFRAERSRSRDAGGTGLGLSIVKHIAESHGGTVDVRSVPGAGSAFRVLLPRAA